MCGVGGGAAEEAGARCDLCGAAAEVHCEADAAFLCAGCDARVHGANFLASRHRRRRVSGPAVAAQEGEESGTSSASSSCMSTAAPPRKMRRPRPKTSRARGEAVLEGWAKRMGLTAGVARRRAAAAGRALRDVAAVAVVPLRVAMAAALWREVAAVAVHRADTLLRLEACAHVPARLVVAVATSMGHAGARSTPAAVDAEEGWDECP